VIQYRLEGVGIDLVAAAGCSMPILAALRWHGPWTAEHDGQAVVLSQVIAGWKPTAWGSWADSAIPGLRFRLAEPLPDLVRLRRPRLARLDHTEVELACGLRIAIPPAVADGMAYGRDGRPDRPATPYNRALCALLDRRSQGSEPTEDEWLGVVRLAIQTGHRLTNDAIDEMLLIAEVDAPAYFEAMMRGPKAPPAGAG